MNISVSSLESPYKQHNVIVTSSGLSRSLNLSVLLPARQQQQESSENVIIVLEADGQRLEIQTTTDGNTPEMNIVLPTLHKQLESSETWPTSPTVMSVDSAQIEWPSKFVGNSAYVIDSREPTVRRNGNPKSSEIAAITALLTLVAGRHLLMWFNGSKKVTV